MKQPSERARSILEQYRAFESLEGTDKQRLLDSIQERGARGDFPQFEVQTAWPIAPSPSWPARVWSSLFGKVATGVTIAAVPLAVAFGVRGGSSSKPAAVSPPADTHDRLAPENPAPVVPAPAAEPASPPLAGVSPPSTGAKPRARPDKSSEAPPAAEGLGEPTIDEEVRLLSAAQTALRSGDAARSLQLLNEHATRFPASKLADARAIARMNTLCKLGQAQAARKEAERFVSRFPNSPFADRAKKACLPEASP